MGIGMPEGGRGITLKPRSTLDWGTVASSENTAKTGAGLQSNTPVAGQASWRETFPVAVGLHVDTVMQVENRFHFSLSYFLAN